MSQYPQPGQNGKLPITKTQMLQESQMKAAVNVQCINGGGNAQPYDEYLKLEENISFVLRALAGEPIQSNCLNEYAKFDFYVSVMYNNCDSQKARMLYDLIKDSNNPGDDNDN